LGKKGPKIRKWRNLGVDVIQPGSRSVSGDSWGCCGLSLTGGVVFWAF